MAPIAVLDGVSRRYRAGTAVVTALDGVSLHLLPGEMVALVGPSGCGKSTTLNLVSGADTPDEGEVIVCGVDVRRAGVEALTLLRRRQIGIVFQAFHLVPPLTVEENAALPLSLDGRRDAARVLDLLQRVGLASRRRHLPGELSGGEQQRAAVARALAAADLELVPLTRWTSPRSGATYPARLRLRIPRAGRELEVASPLADALLVGGGAGNVRWGRSGAS